VFRIDREPETWLFVGREPGAPMMRMTAIEPPAVGTALAGQNMRQLSAGTGDGEVLGEQGSSGVPAVRYAILGEAEDADEFGLVLDWDGERQAFAGTRVEPLDVEVFRRSESAG
jgi:hypothetical protein